MKGFKLTAEYEVLVHMRENCTGEVDRDKMLTHLKEEAVAIPDKEERVEFVPGTIRGKQVTDHYILMYNVLFK